MPSATHMFAACLSPFAAKLVLSLSLSLSLSHSHVALLYFSSLVAVVDVTSLSAFLFSPIKRTHLLSEAQRKVKYKENEKREKENIYIYIYTSEQM